jgi:hypothetical protein
MSIELTPEQRTLLDAVCAVLDAADPAQAGKNGSFAALLVYGSTSTFHAMCLSKYMTADNPLHDLAYALWKRRAVINPYWVNRSARAG